MNKIILTVGTSVVVLAGVAWWFFSGNNPEQPLEDTMTKDVAEAEIRIIAFGDSLTAGYGIPLRDAYPAQLERALQDQGYDVAVVNSGVSGETTRGNLERAEFIRSQEADVVLLGIGGNDALRILDVKNTKENISATIDILQAGENPPTVLLLQMQAPLNAGTEFKTAFDSLYQDIATSKNIILVPFLTQDIFFVEGNKLSDGIHYNAIGYQKVVEQHILPAVIKILDNQ